MGKMILVTGGAGYIGSHTVHKLILEGYKLVVLDNLVYGHRDAIIDESVTLVEGDLGDHDLLTKLFKTYAFEAVVHFAAYALVGESNIEPSKYYHNNVSKPLILLDVMGAFGCKYFIFSSSCAVYGNPTYSPMDEKHSFSPLSPYGQSKLMLEKIIEDYGQAYGLKYVFLRYFNAAGASEDASIGEDHSPETHLIPLVIQVAQGLREAITVFGTDYDTPDGTCIRDYIHVLDLAKAHVLAIKHLFSGKDSLKCNLGTGKGNSVNEIIDLVKQVSGKKVNVIYGPRRAGDPTSLVADARLANDILGWQPDYTDCKKIIETAWNWHNGPLKGRYIK